MKLPLTICWFPSRGAPGVWDPALRSFHAPGVGENFVSQTLVSAVRLVSGVRHGGAPTLGD